MCVPQACVRLGASPDLHCVFRCGSSQKQLDAGEPRVGVRACSVARDRMRKSRINGFVLQYGEV